MANTQANWSELLTPVTELFSTSQIQMLLLAWLPLKLGDHLKTNIYSVDMFLVTLIATGVTCLLSILHTSGFQLFQFWQRNKDRLSVQVDYYRQGPWGEEIANTHYTSLAWMIGHASKGLDTGSFIVVPKPEYENQDEILDFNILPQHYATCEIIYEGHKYQISFNQQQEQNNDHGNGGGGGGGNHKKVPPSLIVTTMEARDVAWFTKFLKDVTGLYKANEASKKERGRWELDENGNWFYVLKLHGNRGLESVALDEEQEKLLQRDLDTFLADHDFYARIGLPYRRGYLFHGKPGTGKTSLVNAIAAALSRDLYYLNLRGIKSDSQLQSAFSRVPENSVIVFEDIDAMSRVCHRRDRKRNALAALLESGEGIFGGGEGETGPKPKSGAGLGFGLSGLSGGPFTLSALLNCLDGHVMEPGQVVIMTTNHSEVLDPALIRPGRVDLQLELAYVTRYQVRRMYKNVVLSNADLDSAGRCELDEEWLAGFEEGVVPPCEVMRVMILYRREPELIPVKLEELVVKYRGGAMSAEEEEEHRRRLELLAQEAKEQEEKGEAEKKEGEDGEEKKEEEKKEVGSSRVDLQACKLEYSIVSPK